MELRSAGLWEQSRAHTSTWGGEDAFPAARAALVGASSSTMTVRISGSSGLIGDTPICTIATEITSVATPFSVQVSMLDRFAAAVRLVTRSVMT